MQNKRDDKGKDDKLCWNGECPYQKPHEHVTTNNGSYIKYIVEPPKIKEQDNADTWR